MLKRLFTGFLDEASEAIGVTQLGRAFLGLASGFGYGHVIVLDPSKFGGSARKAIVFTEQGRSDLADFADKNGYAAHPAVIEALAADRPFVVDDVRERISMSEADWVATLPPPAREGQAMLLPVHRNGRCVLIAGCAGPGGDMSPLARATLHAAAHVFYDRLVALQSAEPSVDAQLTQREAECLRWMGHGKTGSEIAKITGISARTVRYHLRNVKRKLGVNSALEALVKLSANARRVD